MTFEFFISHKQHLSTTTKTMLFSTSLPSLFSPPPYTLASRFKCFLTSLAGFILHFPRERQNTAQQWFIFIGSKWSFSAGQNPRWVRCFREFTAAVRSPCNSSLYMTTDHWHLPVEYLRQPRPVLHFTIARESALVEYTCGYTRECVTALTPCCSKSTCH